MEVAALWNENVIEMIRVLRLREESQEFISSLRTLSR
jgi:hypothetical protein